MLEGLRSTALKLDDLIVTGICSSQCVLFWEGAVVEIPVVIYSTMYYIVSCAGLLAL